jgi:hypothetical protein
MLLVATVFGSLEVTVTDAVVVTCVGALLGLIAKEAELERRLRGGLHRVKGSSSRKRATAAAVVIVAAVSLAAVFAAGGHGGGAHREFARNGGLVAAPVTPGAEKPKGHREAGPAHSCFETRHPRQPASETDTRPERLRTVLVGNNPQPRTGAPHGLGISHREYPNGYVLNGRPVPSFNNYIDYFDGAPNDERAFLGARLIGPNPCPADSFEVRRKIRVLPGDTIAVSIYIHNNGPASHNDAGNGPAVARNTRIGVSLPLEPAVELQMAAWLFAENAVVEDDRPQVHTISDNLSILSRRGVPIAVRYVKGSARLLQSRQSRDERSNNYQSWIFTPTQAKWLFSPEKRIAEERWNIAPHSGVAIGNTGQSTSLKAVGAGRDAALGWWGCNTYHGYLDFLLRVEKAPTILDG